MMKRIISFCFMILILCTLPTSAFAVEVQVCYPTAVTKSEDGKELRKMYDLGPEDDPAGIPRSDFDQDGFHYTLSDLLKQERPEVESRPHTETLSVDSKSKDMASVLSLLPQTREVITEDGMSGILELQLETVKVEVAGYGSSTKNLTPTRTYPGLADQDTQYIPKSIQDNGYSLALQAVDWQTDQVRGEDGSERYTAIATYAGSTTSSYVKGYTVTAEYTGTVSRINLSKIRYVAVYEGAPIQPDEPTPPPSIPEDDVPLIKANWTIVFIPIGVIALAGLGLGAGLIIKHHWENNEDGGEEE